MSYGGAPPAQPSDLAAAQEEQAAVEEKRKELFTLFKNLAKIVFAEALAFVGSALGTVFARQDAPWQVGCVAQLVVRRVRVSGCWRGGGTLCCCSECPLPYTELQHAASREPKAARPCVTCHVSQPCTQEVEVAVSLLYELGEGAPDDALKAEGGGLASLALALVQRGPPPAVARHRLVALAHLECCVRYARVLQQQQAAIPPALAAFLDARGMGHPADDVSTRACYLFSRLVKILRQNVRPYLPDVLASLEPHLQRIATTPLAAAAGGGAAGGGGGAAAMDGVQGSGKASAPVNACVDDRLYVFDAVGLLLGQDDLAPEQQLQLLGSLLQPLLRQVEGSLPALRAASAASAPGSGASVASAAAAAQASASAAGLVLQSLEAINRLSKGFRTDVVTRQRPQLAGLFVRALEVAVAAPAAAPANKPLRARFISFVHRMVECLGPALLPYLPPALEVLLSTQADVQVRPRQV